jgi:hypothetical protein
MHPRTPRAVSDRGRYPEEAGQEETQREETPSDDDDVEADDLSFAVHPGGSEPIHFRKASTPANSVDDLTMSISASPSASSIVMDVDMVGYPLFPRTMITDLFY